MDPVEPRRRKITRVRAGRALPEKHPHSNRFRPRLFQSLNLPQPNQRRKFIAFAHHALGSRRAARHRAPHNILRNLAQISFNFRISSFELCCRHELLLSQQMWVLVLFGEGSFKTEA
jgi:hypothetical protein